MYLELCSATRDDLAFPEDLMQRIRASEVKSVLEFEPGEKLIGWFCVVETIKKTTRNKRIFYRVKITDNLNNTGWLRVWGGIPKKMVPYTVWLTKARNDPQWGASTSLKDISEPLIGEDTDDF
jgi:hypothetical protein